MDLRTYLHTVFPYIPWAHWAVIGVVTLAIAVYLLLRKKYSTYGVIVLAITVFIGLFLLDTAVLARWGERTNHETGFSIIEEYNRLLHISGARRMEMLSNVAVFVPFGFFLAEFITVNKKVSIRRRIGLVILCALGLSLCIESLQLAFQIGVFEITDLILNSLGALIGVMISIMVRKVSGISSSRD